MSIRIKIARWLAPEIFREHAAMEKTAAWWMDRTEYWSVKAMRRNDLLRTIAAQRTPKANGTVRRICDMADAEINRSDDE